MYPGPDVLEEVGRVTIAGSRLDIQMGMLWHHLDRSTDLDHARRSPGALQSRSVRRLAKSRLVGDMRREALAAVDAADLARARRNEIVHQDWLLRGPDAMRPVAELARVDPADLTLINRGLFVDRQVRDLRSCPPVGLDLRTNGGRRLLVRGVRAHGEDRFGRDRGADRVLDAARFAQH